MKLWIIHSILAFLLWGFWPIFQKSSIKWTDPMWAYLFSSVGAISTTIFIVLLSQPSRGGLHLKGLLFGILSGVCGSLGVLFFTLAVSKGKASIVVPFTALYPVVSIMLGLILFKETISLAQSIGIILALIAGVLLSL